MRHIVFRNHQHPGGILINAMHNSGAFLPVNAAQLVSAVKHQRIDQCAARMSGSRMHHHPLWLIHHDDIRILI